MEDSPWSDFREWLQRMRRRQGLSQAKLAALMGCTANYIWRLEKGGAASKQRVSAITEIQDAAYTGRYASA